MASPRHERRDDAELEISSLLAARERVDDVIGAERAVDVVAEVSPRVGLVLKADIRPGYDGQLTAKVARIEQALSQEGDRGQ